MENHTTLPPLAHNLIGQTFVRWTVLSFFGVVKEKSYWLCRCSCGTERPVSAAHLVRGKSKSCGCLQREWAVHKGHDNATHGLSTDPVYHIWALMIQRCTNPKYDNFPNYGGRGIKVCDKWLHDFQAFYDDMGPRPSPKHSIDRIDNDGDYTPDNCHWATGKEQGRNTSRNLRLTYRGETRTLSEWSEITKIGSTTLRRRLELGWSVEEVLTQPLKGHREYCHVATF